LKRILFGHFIIQHVCFFQEKKVEILSSLCFGWWQQHCYNCDELNLGHQTYLMTHTLIIELQSDQGQ